MSSLVLRSLLLPESNVIQSPADKAKFKGLVENQSVETASALGKVDSLRLSGFSSHDSRGRVPIQLIQPDEMQSQPVNTQSKPNNHKSSSGSNPILSALTGMNSSGKPLIDLRPEPVNQSKATQTKDESLFAFVNPASSSLLKSPADSKKVIGNPGGATGVIKFVDVHLDATSDKLSNAIAKIEDWDRKVGALDAILDEQKKSKTDMSELVITGSQRLTTARSDATKAREEAITSFNEAIKGINDETLATGMRSPLFNDYKNSRDQMEKMFNSTMAKDKSTMGKVMDYLKATLTADNLNRALSFINPLSDKY
jgi:hypothetical protein